MKMEEYMKSIILMMILAISFNVHSGDIIKCQDKNGNISFSDTPCPNGSNNKVVRSNSTAPAGTEKHRNMNVTIQNQEDFNAFVKNLHITKMSQVMQGVRKDSFHGLDIQELFSAKSVSLEDWGSGNNKLEFLVNVNDELKMFAVAYRVEVDGAGDHAFLDLPTDKIISAMKSNGFGLPQNDDGVNKWKWKIDNADCEFMYERNLHNPEKKFIYQCTVM